jgi:hypothetical protein
MPPTSSGSRDDLRAARPVSAWPDREFSELIHGRTTPVQSSKQATKGGSILAIAAIEFCKDVFFHGRISQVHALRSLFGIAEILAINGHTALLCAYCPTQT